MIDVLRVYFTDPRYGVVSGYALQLPDGGRVFVDDRGNYGGATWPVAPQIENPMPSDVFLVREEAEAAARELVEKEIERLRGVLRGIGKE